MPGGRRSCRKPSRRCRSGSSGGFPNRPPYPPRSGSTSPRPETDRPMSCTLNSDRECLKVVDTFRPTHFGHGNPGDIDFVAESDERTTDVCTVGNEESSHGENVDIAVVLKSQ